MAGLNQTATQFPVIDYVPQKQYPSFSVQPNSVVNVTSLGAGPQTLTAAEIIGGLIIGVPTAAANYTTDTAANIINAIEGAQVGSSIRFILRNKSAGANTITLVAGTGVTLNSGDTVTVAQSNQKEFLIVVTGIGASPALTIYSLGTIVY